MIYKWVADSDFEAETLKLASELAKLPSQSLMLTKMALNKSFTNDLNDQILLEREYKCMAGQSADYLEGVDAFLTKRKPEFNKSNAVILQMNEPSDTELNQAVSQIEPAYAMAG